MRAVFLLVLLAGAAAADCNQAAKRAVTLVSLPGRPFEPIPTPDGCWVFVSTLGNGPGAERGIAVVGRSDGKLGVKRFFASSEFVTGMTLTHAGKILIAGTGNGVLFLDAARLIEGGNPVVGRVATSQEKPSASYVSVTSDDQFLFVSNESSGTISVINMAKRTLVGNIPTGRAPIAVTLSPDDRYLYSTSEVAPKRFGWPATCSAEGPQHPPGVILVVDVKRAQTDPANSIVSKSAGGCSPVRLVLSPQGQRAYVSVRGEDAVWVFDTEKLVSDPQHAKLAAIAVGPSPVGVAVVQAGSRLVVANSNRFAGGEQKQHLSVLDISSGKNQLMGLIQAEVFPRELRVTADGNTLLVTNFGSKTLEVVDLGRLSEVSK